MKNIPKAKKTNPPQSNLINYLSIALLAIITYLAFQPALKNDFTNWDDDKYVYENPILKKEKSQAVIESFSKPYYLLYTPLTLLSYGFNYWYQGPEAKHFILTNILLHILNSLLVMILVWIMTRSTIAGIAAGIFFALHPMHVESVGWISERKDVLYTLFFFTGMITWLKYQQNKSSVWYACTFIAFIASCLSKPSAVIFPVILILLDLWHQMKENKPIKLVNFLLYQQFNKIPFLLVSLIFGWILLFGVETQGGQMHNEGFSSHSFGLFENILIAIYSFVWYPIKALWPMDLCAFYAYPSNSEPLPWYIMMSPLAFILFAAITFIAWKKKQATLLFSCLFFIVSIFLFIKVLTTVGAITYDRYFYVASFGFCLLFGVGIQYLHQSKTLRILGFIILAGASTFWFWKTQNQLKIWENSFTLTGNMLEYYPKHLPFAYNNRGLWLNEQKRLPEAVENFKNAILLDPNSPNAWLNAGKSFGEMGKPDSAILYLENCLKRSEGDSKVYNNLGNAYGLLGNFPKALQNFEKAIALDPDNANALYNLAVTYGIQGDTLKADSILRISAQKGNEGARNSLNARGKL